MPGKPAGKQGGLAYVVVVPVVGVAAAAPGVGLPDKNSRILKYQIIKELFAGTILLNNWIGWIFWRLFLWELRKY